MNIFKKNYLLIISFLAILTLSLPIIMVQAQIPPPITPGSITNPLNATSFTELINDLAAWIFMIAIPLATLMFLIGGFMFMVSGGNEEKITRAKKTMLWSAVGLAICLIGAGFTYIIGEILGVE